MSCVIHKRDIYLSLAGAWLFPVFVADNGIGFSYSHLSLIYIAGIYALLAYTEKLPADRRLFRYTRILGALLSLMTTCGYYLENTGAVPYLEIKWLCAVVTYTEIFGCILRVLWSHLVRAERKLSSKETLYPAASHVDRFLGWLCCKPAAMVILLLLCWTPCYLSNYPGFFFYDAEKEFIQSVSGYSAEFPMLHSVLIIGILKISYGLTQSYNTGIAFYVIAQMILLAILFVHILRKFAEYGKNRVVLAVLTAYFALFPVIHVLVTTSVRDVLFSGLITWLIFQVYEITRDPLGFFDSNRKSFSLGLTISLTILARSNFVGVIPFAVISGTVSFLWLLFRKKLRRKWGWFCISFVGSYIALGCMLMAVCFPVRESTLNNSLSFFTQPISRAYFYEQENWTEDQRLRFAEFFDMDSFTYVAENADKTKSCCMVDKNLFFPFLRFWCSMGIRYPAHYMDGILASSLQMWFPGSPVDAYVESGDWNCEKTFFFIMDELEQPGVHQQWFPHIRSFYRNIGMKISFEKIPVVSMLFSIGFHFWVLANGVCYLFYRRKYATAIPLIMLLIYALITALSPLVYLRYYAALFMTFPVTLVLTIQPGHNDEGKL